MAGDLARTTEKAEELSAAPKKLRGCYQTEWEGMAGQHK